MKILGIGKIVGGDKHTACRMCSKSFVLLLFVSDFRLFSSFLWEVFAHFSGVCDDRLSSIAFRDVTYKIFFKYLIFI